MTQQDLENRFTYHAPDEAKVHVFKVFRDYALGFARHIDQNVPEGREKSLAITKLEEVVMWANAGLARAPKDPTP